MSPGDGVRTVVAERLEAVAERYGLGGAAVDRLSSLLGLLVDDPHAPTAIRDPAKVIDDHLADSLVGLELAAVRESRIAADLGAGAGLPGLALAIALPGTEFTLVESVARKFAFLERAVERCALGNVTVVHARAESWAAGLGRNDLVTARALAAPDVVAEYGAPLLRVEGALVLWRGRRDERAEAALARAAAQLGLGEPEILRVAPYPGAEHRHLYLLSKLRETPAAFPRRPGMALKRPLGAR